MRIKKKGRGSKWRLHWRVHGSISSPTGDGSRGRVFEVLCDLECPVGLSQKRSMCSFHEGSLAQFGRSVEK